jgi:hypothetical protein
MSAFRKKPVVIEAVQFVADGLPEVPRWLSDAIAIGPAQGGVFRIGDELHVFTLEGVTVASDGDWIIRGIKGELYACKPDIFALTYEPADATPPAGAGEAVAIVHMRDGFPSLEWREPFGLKTGTKLYAAPTPLPEAVRELVAADLAFDHASMGKIAADNRITRGDRSDDDFVKQASAHHSYDRAFARRAAALAALRAIPAQAQTAPPGGAAQGREWEPAETAPSAKKVLACFQTRGFRIWRTVVAVRYEKFQHEDDSGDFDGAEYNEATDAYYWPAGWYEVGETEGKDWWMNDEITHWRPLPEPPAAALATQPTPAGGGA